MYSSLLLDVNQPAVTFDHPVWTETDILSKELTDSILSENFGATPDYTCNNTSSQFLFDIEDIATSTCDAAFNDTVSLSSGIDTSSRLDADSDSDQFIFQLDAEDGTRLSIYNAGSNTGPQSTNRNPLESVPDTLFTFDTFLELDLLNECLNIGNNDFDSASLSGTSEDTQKDYVEIPHSTPCTIPSPDNNNSFCWPNIDYATAKRRSLLYDKNEFQKSSSQNHSLNQERSKSSPKISPNPAQSTKHHDHQRTYRCPVLSCDKIYLKASHLRSHVRRHTGIKPFACDWNGCEWRFSRSDELARHKRSHSGIKPYACNICDKAFSRSDHLSKHAKVHMKKMALYGTPVITKKCNYKYLSLNKIDTNLL